MNTLRRFITTAALAFAASGLASADQIVSYSSTFSAATDFTHVFSLSKFNLAGQTLTGVTLSFTGSEDTSGVTLQNQAGTTLANGVQTFRYISSSILDTFNNTASPDLPGQVSLPIIDTKTIVLGGAGSNSNQILCPTSTPSASCNTVGYTPPDIIGGPLTTTAIVSAGNFGGYTGAGNFSVTGETSTFTTFSGGGGNILLNQTTAATETVTVTYSYLPTSGTPEPTTMLLFGSGLLGLGLIRKRVRR
ncbi:MAG: choice-of-anchor E domain-containing protein [Terriglobia bacterium]